MKKNANWLVLGLGIVSWSFLGPASVQAIDPDAPQKEAALKKALTFFASFENGMDAEFGGGDRRVFSASSAQRKDGKPGLPREEWEIASNQGRNGGNALRFVKRSQRVAYFPAKGNIAYQTKDWSGTISFWLNLDPNVDLGDWYCDPIQITEKAWNDAAIWVDFTKSDKPKHFRLGVLSDLSSWNPKKTLDFDKLPPGQQPSVVLTTPPFFRGRWTHVAITFDNFNTDKADGMATLYLDGKPTGSISPRNQTFSWDIDKAAIQIGMGYVGLFDELALFRRALTPEEISFLQGFSGKWAQP